MPLIDPDFTFSHQHLSSVDLNVFSDSFNQLIPDQHVDGQYRYRRYSRLTGSLDNPQCLDDLPFFQSKTVNYLNGDIDRCFEALEGAVIELPQFKQLMQSIGDFFGFDPAKTILGVHQIRVVCTSDETGCPVPEGIHQDGFDLIAMCCIAKCNIEGAESQIFNDPKLPALYQCTMEPGDIIYCNDRTMYHYASPVKPECPGFEGYRDMFVITVSLSEQQWQPSAKDSTSTPYENNFQHLNA